ncbi:MAG: hypothetical protein ACXQT4_07580 [Methanotrichaceae archaeon]
MSTWRKDLLEQDELWILLFILGIFLLNWPLLSLAVGESRILGYPLVLVYISIVWLMIILFAYLFERWTSD